jgi:hypothetical protein
MQLPYLPRLLIYRKGVLFFAPAYLSLGLRRVWHFEASEMSLPGQEPPRKYESLNKSGVQYQERIMV